MALLDAAALADAIGHSEKLPLALARYARARRRHVALYQSLSRWLTPLFQSDATWLGLMRDIFFGPLGRLPLARREMLKILAGTKRGWFG